MERAQWPPCVIVVVVVFMSSVIYILTRCGRFELVCVAVALLIFFKLLRGVSWKSKNAPLTFAAHNPTSFQFTTEKAAPLWASEKEMDWFEEVVGQIMECTFGMSAWGDTCGEPINSWRPGEFRKALHRLRAFVADPLRTSAVFHEPIDDAVLARVLIAVDLNHEHALELVNKYVAYRFETSGGIAPTLSHLESGLFSMPCEDRMGRPVIFVRPCYHVRGNPKFFRNGVEAAFNMVVAHLLNQRQKGFKQSNPLEQFILVCDLMHAGLANVDFQCLPLISEIGNNYFPNRLAQMYLLNVNWTFFWLYNNVIKHLMTPRTRRKTVVVETENIAKCLRDLIPVDRLPPEYGGSGTAWPIPRMCTTLEDQIGELGAHVLLGKGIVPKGAKPERGSVDAALTCPEDGHKTSDESWDLGIFSNHLQCICCR